MQHIAFEFDSEAEARQELQRLWEEKRISGEAVLRPSGERWRLEIFAEAALRESQLEKVRGRRIEL